MSGDDEVLESWEDESDEPPPLRVIMRDHRGGVSLRQPTLGAAPTEGGTPRWSAAPALPFSVADSTDPGCHFSFDGSMVATTTEGGVEVCMTEGGAAVSTVVRARISALAWSPLGNFLLSWERPQKGEPNLFVWRAADGAQVASFSQKDFSSDAWPTVKWSSDEAIAARMVANTVHIFEGGDIGAGIVERLQLKHIAQFSLAPGPPPYKFATFQPEIKGAAASVRMYHHPQLAEGQAVAAKSFFKAQNINMQWESQGRALLVCASSDVDESGKTYDAVTTGVHYLSSDGRFDCTVPLNREGPIHHVSWSPSCMEFAVVYGFMPAAAALFDHRCKQLFSFGVGPRNQVLWSPHNRVLALCGFGNLPGDVEYWDRKEQKLLRSFKARDTVYAAWSPCSQYLLTATLFPRLRVDNGIKVWGIDGSVMYEEKVDCDSRSGLYQACWQTAAPGVFPRPPPPLAAGKEEGGAAAGGGAYRRPGQSAAPARGRTLAELAGELGLSVGRGGGVAAYKPPGRDQQGVVPGMELKSEEVKLTKAQLKNKKRKEKKKAEAAEAATAKAEAAAAKAATEQAAIVAREAPPASEAEKVKAIKKVNKKLRQIQDLKAKQATGAALEDSQVEKLANEDALKAELAGFEALSV